MPFRSTAQPRTAGTGPADLILVQRALRGDGPAVDQLLERLSCVVRFVMRLDRMLGCRLTAEALEDVVQQVYAAFWPRLRDFDGSAALETWVFGFCRNCLRSEARRRNLAARTPAVEPRVLQESRDPRLGEPELDLLRRERAEALHAELAALPAEEREAVQLRHFEGLSFEEIARRRQVAASTIKDRCYRALERIRERLRRRQGQ